MPLFDLKCDACGLELFDVLQPVKAEVEKCPKCGSLMRRKFGTFSVRGFFRWMNDGKPDDIIVSYPGGHTRRKRHNELYMDGGL